MFAVIERKKTKDSYEVKGSSLKGAHAGIVLPPPAIYTRSAGTNVHFRKGMAYVFQGRAVYSLPPLATLKMWDAPAAIPQHLDILLLRRKFQRDPVRDLSSLLLLYLQLLGYDLMVRAVFQVISIQYAPRGERSYHFRSRAQLSLPYGYLLGHN